MRKKTTKVEYALISFDVLVFIFFVLWIAFGVPEFPTIECERIELPAERYNADSIVRINTCSEDEVISCGTGFLKESGIIITASHVLTGGNKVVIYYQDGTVEESRDFTCYGDTDVATIKVNKSAKTLEFSKHSYVGDKIYVAGYPYNIERLRVTEGIIASGEQRGIKNWGTYFVIDCIISPGNSGGPVIDKNGRVVGMVVGAGEGFFIALPASLLEETIYGEEIKN
jgi:S1-C subfamily serine protease